MERIGRRGEERKRKREEGGGRGRGITLSLRYEISRRSRSSAHRAYGNTL